mgnify:CR=1 FL=1
MNLGQVQSLISNSNVNLSTKKLGDLINDNLNKKIINVLDPVDNQDVSTKKYVDDKFLSINIPVAVTSINGLSCLNHYDMNNNKLINLADGQNSKDAVNYD